MQVAWVDRCMDGGRERGMEVDLMATFMTVANLRIF